MDFGSNRQNLLVVKFCSTVGTNETCNSNLLTWAFVLIIIYLHSNKRLITSVYYMPGIVLYITVLQF